MPYAIIAAYQVTLEPNVGIRIKDKMNGIIREIHPNRGLIKSGNQIRKDANKLIRNQMVDQTRKRSHETQEDPHVPKIKPPTTLGKDYPICITMDNNQIPTTSTNHPKRSPIGLTDLPTETIQNIMRHLPFQDIMKLRRNNKRFWLLAGMKSLWKDITISNTPLSCGLISVAISKQVNALNIRNCSIQGSYLKIPRPTRIQRKRHPGRNHHSRIYRIGVFRPIREQILHGRDHNRQNEERQ